MANWQHCPAVERDPAKAGGAWVFKDTDVPLFALYEALASGMTVEDFATRHKVAVERVVAALRYEADEFRDDLLIRPDGPGEIAPIPSVIPTGAEIPDWHDCPAVERIAGKVSGAWVFKHSRLALYTLYYHLAGGSTIDQFDEWYSMDTANVVAALEHEVKALRTHHLHAPAC